jgi:hypothetical protein
MPFSGIRGRLNKIVGKPASPFLACFEHSGPRDAGLYEKRSPSRQSPPEEILARADAERLDGARTRGSNGVFQERARTACGDTSVWRGLARTCRRLGGGPRGHSLRGITQDQFGRALRAVHHAGLQRGSAQQVAWSRPQPRG